MPCNNLSQKSRLKCLNFKAWCLKTKPLGNWTSRDILCLKFRPNDWISGHSAWKPNWNVTGCLNTKPVWLSDMFKLSHLQITLHSYEGQLSWSTTEKEEKKLSRRSLEDVFYNHTSSTHNNCSWIFLRFVVPYLINAAKTAHISSLAPCLAASVSRSESSKNLTCFMACKRKFKKAGSIWKVFKSWVQDS